jgi:hypothetical protein
METSPLLSAVVPWLRGVMDFRQRLFLATVEPVIELLLGPADDNYNNNNATTLAMAATAISTDVSHRRLSFIPTYLANVKAYKETSMSFATMFMLFVTLSCVFLVFCACFYHSQKTAPLFLSPRRHRLPQLVPPPLPVDSYWAWVRVCLFVSDEEIIKRVGYDSLVFLRFHRLALRCIVKMSLFSCAVLLPINFTGGENANAQGLGEYVGTLFFTDFMLFTMANVQRGSPRFWVHCFAAYLLTAIVCYELLKEYELFNSIRHRYLLSREPHLRTVLVTNIPRHLRSASKLSTYFKHVYPNAVKDVFVCQNCIQLEAFIAQRTKVLTLMEKELLILCRTEKKKLYERNFWKRFWLIRAKMEDCGMVEASQERLAKFYAQLEVLNECIEKEQKRRRRVMKMLDRIPAGEGAADIDYVLASPFVTDETDPVQRRILGLDAYAPPHRKGDAQTQTHTTLPALRSLPEENEDDGDGGQGQEGQNVSNGMHDTILTTTIPSHGDEQLLRSRSPAQPNTVTFSPDTASATAATLTTAGRDGILRNSKDMYKGSRRRRLNPFTKARRVIRNYARFNPSDSATLGRPLHQQHYPGNEANTRMEEHINEVTDKAFVVMRTFTAATIAIQSMHSSKPGAMQVATAPEPRDVLWKNIYVSKGAHRTRTILGETTVLLLIGLYMFPVGLVCFLLSENALVASSPRLAQLDEAHVFFSAW